MPNAATNSEQLLFRQLYETLIPVGESNGHDGLARLRDQGAVARGRRCTRSGRCRRW
jgi:hypothetical protein